MLYCDNDAFVYHSPSATLSGAARVTRIALAASETNPYRYWPIGLVVGSDVGNFRTGVRLDALTTQQSCGWSDLDVHVQGQTLRHY